MRRRLGPRKPPADPACDAVEDQASPSHLLGVARPAPMPASRASSASRCSWKAASSRSRRLARASVRPALPGYSGRLPARPLPAGRTPRPRSVGPTSAAAARFRPWASSPCGRSGKLCSPPPTERPPYAGTHLPARRRVTGTCWRKTPIRWNCRSSSSCRRRSSCRRASRCSRSRCIPTRCRASSSP
jgi:hypothetical protein